VNAILLTFIIIRLGVTVGYWKLFEKAGIEAWKSIIPFYSEYVMMVGIVGKPKWWFIYLLIPVVNFFAYYVLIFEVLRCFGKNSLWSQILIIFTGFFYLIYLGFNPSIRYIGKLHELPPEAIKSPLAEWAEAITFAVVAATLIRWLIMEAYTIPTPSMENSLLVGDFLFVSKYHYGTRTPKTPLQLPLTHQKIWFTEIPSYVDWIQLPQYRLPGISAVKSGDVVVFNIPPKRLNENKDYPVDLKTNYIKRCVAAAGETLQIKNRNVFIDGQVSNDHPLVQWSYQVVANGLINERNLDKLGIGQEDYQITGRPDETSLEYIMWLTPEKADELKQLPYIKSVVLEKQDNTMGVFPNSDYYGFGSGIEIERGWSIDSFGPLWVPKKGSTIGITDSTVSLYGYIITEYDHQKDAKIVDRKLIIDGQEVTEYTFNQNYYFMMGDNRHNSLDSRYWGFVPEDHIAEKGFFIWLSIDPNQKFLNKIRWRRFFKLIE
jgi:signal peptidase I